MEVRTTDIGLEALAELRRELQGELEGLLEKLKGLGRDIESKRRMLELVKATEEQLAAQGRVQQAVDGEASGANTQVRGSTKL
jgi:predicted component of type VI protein secretion system